MVMIKPLVSLTIWR